VKSGFWWAFSSEEAMDDYVAFSASLRHAVPDDEYLSFNGTFPKIHRCSSVGDGTACLGGTSGGFFENNVIAAAAGVCSEGFTGPKCAVCEDGWYNWQGDCRECNSKGKAIGSFVGILVVTAFVLFRIFRSNAKNLIDRIEGGNEMLPDDKMSISYLTRAWAWAKNSRLGRLLERTKKQFFHRETTNIRFMVAYKIVCGYFQVTAAAKSMFSSVPWPSNYSRLIGVFQVASTNPVAWLTPDCITSKIEFNLYFEFAFVTVVPIVAITVTTVYYNIMRCFRGTTVALFAACVKNCCFIVFLVYPIIGSSGFRIIDTPEEICTELKTECKHYLRTDYSVDCDLKRHKTFTGLAITAIVIYSFGLPIALGCYLKTQQDKVAEIANGRLDKNSVSGLVLGLGFAYDDYKPEFWYWEIIDMFRKVFLCAIVMIIRDPNIQLFYGCAVAVVALAIHARFTPYRTSAENWLQFVALASIVATFCIGWLLWTIELKNRSSALYANENADANDKSKRDAGIWLIVAAIMVFLGTVILFCRPKRCLKKSPSEREKTGRQTTSCTNPMYSFDLDIRTSLKNDNAAASAAEILANTTDNEVFEGEFRSKTFSIPHDRSISTRSGYLVVDGDNKANTQKFAVASGTVDVSAGRAISSSRAQPKRLKAGVQPDATPAGKPTSTVQLELSDLKTPRHPAAEKFPGIIAADENV
jgi:hypothetical protein